MMSVPRYPHPSCRRGKEGEGVFPLPLGEGQGEGQDCAEKKESG
ncbi:hypothetical protein [Aeromonas sp. MdU4]